MPRRPFVTNIECDEEDLGLLRRGVMALTDLGLDSNDETRVAFDLLGRIELARDRVRRKREKGRWVL